VRIMPYQTLDSVVDGVVITLIDITATKETESVLRQRSTSCKSGICTNECRL
jgi:two-component system CheB/CheR fusion protein